MRTLFSIISSWFNILVNQVTSAKHVHFVTLPISWCGWDKSCDPWTVKGKNAEAVSKNNIDLQMVISFVFFSVFIMLWDHFSFCSFPGPFPLKFHSVCGKRQSNYVPCDLMREWNKRSLKNDEKNFHFKKNVL